jgi:hypothetical protein
MFYHWSKKNYTVALELALLPSFGRFSNQLSLMIYVDKNVYRDLPVVVAADMQAYGRASVCKKSRSPSTLLVAHQVSPAIKRQIPLEEQAARGDNSISLFS